jgi:hypothetical protein
MTELPYAIASALLATIPVASVLLVLVRSVRRALG